LGDIRKFLFAEQVADPAAVRDAGSKTLLLTSELSPPVSKLP
jgi:hypothetical protein